MALLDVRVFYLELHAQPASSERSSRTDVSVIQACSPTVDFYRFLYNSVGKDYHWGSRKNLSDAALSEIIHDPRVEVQVLYVNGVPAGFAELDRRVSGQIELVQFGLMREFIGQGLGKYFVRWAIEKAWSYQPQRFWLHTCTLDHPAALTNYRNAGFKIYKEESIQREVDN